MANAQSVSVDGFSEAALFESHSRIIALNSFKAANVRELFGRPGFRCVLEVGPHIRFVGKDKCAKRSCPQDL